MAQQPECKRGPLAKFFVLKSTVEVDDPAARNQKNRFAILEFASEFVFGSGLSCGQVGVGVEGEFVHSVG